MSLAKEKKVTEEIGEDVRSLATLLKESAELKALFASPMIKAEQKKICY